MDRGTAVAWGCFLSWIGLLIVAALGILWLLGFVLAAIRFA